MIEQLFYDHVWVAIALWLVALTSDFYLQAHSARLYHEVSKSHYELEGYGYPYFPRDIDALRHYGSAFLFLLWISPFVILVLWAFSVYLKSPDVFAFAMGALLLLEATSISSLLGRIAQAHSFRRGMGIEGKLKIPQWLVIRQSTVGAVQFAILYFLLFTTTGSWFIAGGTASCLIVAWRQWRKEIKVLSALSAAPSTSSTPSR